MIIVDNALEERRREGNPVRVAMVGAGFMGRGIALQILSAVPGMRLVAIANRHVGKAHEAWTRRSAPGATPSRRTRCSSPGIPRSRR